MLDDARTVVILLRQLIGHGGKAASSVVLQDEGIYRGFERLRGIRTRR